MNVDPHNALVVGVDYGTLSGRAVVVRVRDGQIVADDARGGAR